MKPQIESGTATMERTHESKSYSRSHTREGLKESGQPREVVIMQKKNEKYENTAGFDAKGGYHGSGGHGGNQIKPKAMAKE
jgi:hypothetical protein